MTLPVLSPRSLGQILALGMFLGSAGTAAAQQSAITGKVTDQTNRQPLAGARIQATGTNYFAVTNQQGTYAIRGLAPGAYTLRVIMLGYASIQKPATVTAGQTTTVDWELSPVAIRLEEIVTTATGEQLKRELGNTVGKLEAPQLVTQAQTPDLSAVLNGRIAGVTVIANDGGVGAGSRIRIRGISSASLSTDPLLYVDGIRVSERGPALSVFNGGSSPSFFNDIKPEDIESIEIVKGPSAATLYGTQAANGVIRITTKHGKAGPPKWTLFSEQGVVEDPNKYLSVWWSQKAGGEGQCLPYQQALGDCQIEKLYSRNLMRDPATSPLKTAYRYQYGAQINGGSDAVRYYVSGEFEDQDGTLKMPTTEVDFLKQQRGVTELPDNQLDPNRLRKISLRGNVNVTLSSKADLAINSGYISTHNLIPQTGDNLEGIVGGATFGTADPKAPQPWGFARPAYGLSDAESRLSNHFINSGHINFRPVGWLATRGTVGLDYIGFEDQELARNGEACPFCGYGQGVRQLNRFQSYKYSVDAGATATLKLTKRIESKTSVGAQYNRDNVTASNNLGSILSPGAETFTGAANKVSSESTTRFVTLGSYVEQQFGLDQRLFITGAIRVDQNSAFGADSRSATYPKVSGSFVAIESKEKGLVSSLRFRTAYGTSGQQPGALDAVQFFSGVSAVIFGTGLQPGVILGTPAGFSTNGAGLGNPLLKPERSGEVEGGFDAGLFGNRVSLEATLYRKTTTDALVQRLLPGSLGATAARTDNVGKVKNEGFEISVLGRLLDHPNFQWDVQVELSGNRNRLVELGAGVPPITGFGYQQRVGYPLYGIWWPKMKSFSDANGDGIITPGETVVTDSAVFLGPTIPTRTASVSSTISLFRNKLRVGGQLEYKGGFYSLETNTLFQCDFIQDCQDITDPRTSLFKQARAVSGVFGDYAEDASFIRLREANISWTLPGSVSRALRASNAVVTLTGRNLLHYMPHFEGWDSEINTQAGVFGDGPNYNFVQPGQSRYYTFRVALTY